MKTTIFSLLFFISFCYGQTPYPQHYFSDPLDINLILSGSFAELRTNHFHSGLDIKTQGKEGFKTYAPLPAEEGVALYHPKDIIRQEKQNNYYNTL